MKRETTQRKYANFAQLVQGVSQANDPTLQPTDRLFLNGLAAYSVKENPHPGNRRLMRACGVTTRQGLNKIAKRLLIAKLIEIIDPGGGNHATVYRICVEDGRFPWPKKKPATASLQGSGNTPRNSGVAWSRPGDPATENHTPRNCEPYTPQLETADPATGSARPRNSRVAPEFKTTNTRTNTTSNTTRGEPELPPGASPSAPYQPQLQELIETWREVISVVEETSGSSRQPDSESWREFKMQCKSIGVPWQEIDKAWQEVIRPFQSK